MLSPDRKNGKFKLLISQKVPTRELQQRGDRCHDFASSNTTQMKGGQKKKQNKKGSDEAAHALVCPNNSSRRMCTQHFPIWPAALKCVLTGSVGLRNKMRKKNNCSWMNIGKKIKRQNQ